jgi:hypothetical protein
MWRCLRRLHPLRLLLRLRLLLPLSLWAAAALLPLSGAKRPLPRASATTAATRGQIRESESAGSDWADGREGSESQNSFSRGVLAQKMTFRR